ncbi:hypothetical protein Cgig2_034207 [Carnegiea gigantea]|uniref:Uncharacterized protein n=1 Tax=Carnegiea gigantea TaxID=171969 RepID=A0A9Q1JHU1_9CARY|nr:hypothetical protein Cgig2_034207 [Carnegiea gigantea]
MGAPGLPFLFLRTTASSTRTLIEGKRKKPLESLGSRRSSRLISMPWWSMTPLSWAWIHRRYILAVRWPPSMAPDPRDYAPITEVLEYRLARTNTTLWPKTIGELMAEGLSKGTSTSSSSPSKEESGHVSPRLRDLCGTKSSMASTSCDAPQEVVVVGNAFLEVAACSDLADNPGSHFPNPKVAYHLDQKELEKRYLFPLDYEVVLSVADTTTKASPADCITVYRAAFNYGMQVSPAWSDTKHL